MMTPERLQTLLGQVCKYRVAPTGECFTAINPTEQFPHKIAIVFPITEGGVKLQIQSFAPTCEIPPNRLYEAIALCNAWNESCSSGVGYVACERNVLAYKAAMTFRIADCTDDYLVENFFKPVFVTLQQFYKEVAGQFCRT